MDLRSFRLLTHQWPQKLIAIAVATLVWFLINNTLTVSRTLSNIAVRVINIPPEKTVPGLLPDGTLEKRISITVTGTKSDVELLRSKDLEILVNGTGQPDHWLPYISKRNLVDLSPNGDLLRHLTSVSAEEFSIDFQKLITEKIPVVVPPPVGKPPKGYQYLDVWPQQLLVSVTGPESQIKELKANGLTLNLDMSHISGQDLDALQPADPLSQRDEVSYFVPAEEKRIPLPFHGGEKVDIDDPSAQYLRIDFLRIKCFAVGEEVPLAIFYPLQTSDTLNPETTTLAPSKLIQKTHNVSVLSLPLYASDISGHFVEVIKNHLMLVITAMPQDTATSLPWSLFFADRDRMEQRYVNLSMADAADTRMQGLPTEQRESFFKQRFRHYLYNFRLLTEGGEPLDLDIRWSGSEIVIKQN